MKETVKNSILITGGAGFIGSNLCDYFLSKGNKVICLDNFSTGHRHNLKDFINDRIKVVYSYLNLPCPLKLESDGIISGWFYENLSKFKYSDFFAATQVQYVKNWDKSKLTFKGEMNADV